MDELKKKPGKHLSLFSKIFAFLFFFFNYEFQVISKIIIEGKIKLPGIDETLGLVSAAAFLGMIFIAVDLSILVQNIRGERK